MTCRELDRFVVDYLDGVLAARLKIDLDRHLARCGPCVRYLASYRRTIELCRAAFAAPPDMPEALVRAILAVRRPS